MVHDCGGEVEGEKLKAKQRGKEENEPLDNENNDVCWKEIY